MSAWFDRFARKERLTGAVLREAVRLAESGAVNADLGGYVIKQRVARSGAGKSAGYRTIILYKQGLRAFFVYGFAKSERANIDHEELRAFKKMAGSLLNLSDAELARLIRLQKFEEVMPHDQHPIQE